MSSNFSRPTLLSDAFAFHVSGFVTHQNTRTWGTENPEKIQKQELQTEKIWCAVLANDVVGPYHLSNETVRVVD